MHPAYFDTHAIGSTNSDLGNVKHFTLRILQSDLGQEWGLKTAGEKNAYRISCSRDVRSHFCNRVNPGGSAELSILHPR
jgi:hypothetical protein